MYRTSIPFGENFFVCMLTRYHKGKCFDESKLNRCPDADSRSFASALQIAPPIVLEHTCS